MSMQRVLAHPQVRIGIAIMVMYGVWQLWFAPAPAVPSAWIGHVRAGPIRGTATGPAAAAAAVAAPATPPGQHALVAAPSLTAQQIDAVLAQFDSPAAGTGATWVALGIQYQIDPAYALAFFIHESSAGTNPHWAGLKGGGQTTHNVGNIICAGYATCYGRFRDYPDWQTGIADWFRLIRDEYIQGRGLHTLEQIIPVYAPSSENNVPAYVNAVESLISQWKQ